MPSKKSKLRAQLTQVAAALQPQAMEPKLEQRQASGEKEALEIKEYEQTLSLRSRWSQFLMAMVLVMIVFQMGLFVLVGLGWLAFSDEWIARLVLPGSFAQVLGFVYIIINYLFPNQKQ